MAGSDIFTPKPASSFRPGKDAKAVTSLLSHLLITKPLPVNPFSQFARLDARVSLHFHSLYYYIQLSMC